MAEATSTSTSNLIPNSKPSLVQRHAVPDAPGPSHFCSTEQVVLNVGGHTFTTTIGTLIERSDFFDALYSGRWTIPKLPDGSVFVDADPDIFAHIIRYLRRGVFPLAFDEKSGGHNCKLYVDLLPEARYFQIPLLEKWLEDELYFKCVEHESIWKRLSDSGMGTESWCSDPGAQLVKRNMTTTHSWACPEALSRDAHRHNYGHIDCHIPDKQGAIDRLERTEWVEYGKKLTFHKGWCSDEGREFRDYYRRFMDDNGL